MTHPKPILPTEGVSVGKVVTNSFTGKLDPSTGQDVSVIKFGKQSSQGSDIDGCPKPDTLGSTPPLQTPVVK